MSAKGLQLATKVSELQRKMSKLVQPFGQDRLARLLHEHGQCGLHLGVTDLRDTREHWFCITTYWQHGPPARRCQCFVRKHATASRTGYVMIPLAFLMHLLESRTRCSAVFSFERRATSIADKREAQQILHVAMSNRRFALLPSASRRTVAPVPVGVLNIKR